MQGSSSLPPGAAYSLTVSSCTGTARHTRLELLTPAVPSTLRGVHAAEEGLEAEGGSGVVDISYLSRYTLLSESDKRRHG